MACQAACHNRVMRAYRTRLFATFVLLASLLAPFASGWAMALGVADGRLLVICSGDGLRTIYIDEKGEATQLSDEAVACVLKSAADTSSIAMPQRNSERLLFVAKPFRTANANPSFHLYLSSLPRAPPPV